MWIFILFDSTFSGIPIYFFFDLAIFAGADFFWPVPALPFPFPKACAQLEEYLLFEPLCKTVMLPPHHFFRELLTPSVVTI
jgi:hypothetical protein